MAAAMPTRKPMKGAFAWALPLLLIGCVSVAEAADVSGSAVVSGTTTDSDGVESDFMEQQFNINLFQRFTPYISLRFGFDYFDFTTDTETAEIARRSRQPMMVLLYSRDRVSGRLALYDRIADGSREVDRFEQRSLAANLSWRPTRGPRFVVDYREDRNVADVSAFGRDVDSRYIALEALYSRPSWSASYAVQQTEVENTAGGFRSDQLRHQFRASGSRSLLDDRLSLRFSGWLSRLDRQTRAAQDADLAEPIPTGQGLAAVDTAPEIGELEATPTLIDGDVETPVAPEIDIGGANTFRNIGFDLGVTRPISRIEIFVDRASSPVLWQVYRSRDNLFWEQVPFVAAALDPARLRYRLEIRETADRFFKAVNVSPNSAPQVLVTEVRALLEVDAGQFGGEVESTLYRADLVANFRPTERFYGSVGIGGSTDEDVVAGLVRRDFQEVHADARLTVGLAADLSLNLAYSHSDSENLSGSVLMRTVDSMRASLLWDPLPTVDAVLSAERREESGGPRLLQSQETVRLRLLTELLPDLRLISDLDYSRLDDPFADSDRKVYGWRETVEMRPLPNWEVNGSFAYSRYETREGEPSLKRRQLQLWTTWRPTAFLSLAGTWILHEEDDRRSLNQNYSLSYSPGDRWRLSATYQEFDNREQRRTASDSVSSSYRVTNQFILFGNLSRSRFEESSSQTSKITSLRAGARLAF